MTVYLFAGIAVGDFAGALAWYEVAGTAARGLAPASQETYGNGVRKTTYVDPEGNEIGFGQVPG